MTKTELDSTRESRRIWWNILDLWVQVLLLTVLVHLIRYRLQKHSSMIRELKLSQIRQGYRLERVSKQVAKLDGLSQEKPGESRLFTPEFLETLENSTSGTESDTSHLPQA